MEEGLNPDIYLYLLRDPEEKPLSEWTPIDYPKFLNPKSIIIGESTDAPFVGMINVQDVDHKISYGGEAASSEEEVPVTYSDTGHSFIRAYKGEVSVAEHRARAGVVPSNARATFETGNAFLTNVLPEHESLSFTKFVDKATPQLAFGCTAQERFPVGVFFFRRKIGLGLAGARMPYLVIGLGNCIISSWSLKGDRETVQLRYKSIAWAATAQLSDTNVSIPGFTRYWDTDSRTGGEGGWALKLQAITALLMAATGGIAALVPT